MPITIIGRGIALSVCILVIFLFYLILFLIKKKNNFIFLNKGTVTNAILVVIVCGYLKLSNVEEMLHLYVDNDNFKQQVTTKLILNKLYFFEFLNIEDKKCGSQCEKI